MDGFLYVNLFDTKGIEYIIIIAFLLLIIPFWSLLNRPLKIRSGIRNAFSSLSSSLLSVPQGVFISNNHTWTHMLRSGNARVGIDNLLINLTGDVEVKMLRKPGTRVNKGEELSVIEREGRKLTILSPVSGELTDINPALQSDPSLLQEDPYGKGWICAVRPTAWKAEISGFHLAEEANTWLKNELARIRDFMAVTVNKYNPESSTVALQDGGELAEYPLASLPKEAWDDFQAEFLK